MIDKADDPRFQWCRFYEAFADGLMAYRSKRAELSSFVRELGYSLDITYIKNYDKHIKSCNKQFEDIDPFTVMGMFNQHSADAIKSSIAEELADLLDFDEPVPDTFNGIPFLYFSNAWFVRYGKGRKPAAYTEALWNFLDKALHFADNNDLEADDFCKAYDKVAGQKDIGWKPTIALHWIRPWNFVSLYGGPAQAHITNTLKIDIEKNGPKHSSRRYCSAHDYLKVRDELKQHNSDCPLPEMSFDIYHKNANKVTKKK